jgi:hypothetical protein
MAAVNLLNSNQTGLRVAKELTLKNLPVTPTWNPQDPNGYSDFGGELKTMTRNPIRDDRQTAKGVPVALTAAGHYTMDFTYPAMKHVLPSFFYANFRLKAEFGGAGEILAVTASTFTAAAGLTVFAAADLVFADGFSKVLGNNGLKRVTTAAAAVLTVAEAMVAETAPAGATLVKVGKQFAAGALAVVVTGPLPVVTGPVGAFTGVIAGEWVYFGDATDPLFSWAVAACNGWKRVRSVAVDGSSITIDKSRLPLTVDSGATKTIRLFFGRVLKNEQSALIVRTSLQFERTLGAPDDALPAQIQSEYVIGAVGNELSFDYKPADKLVCDLAFVACDVEQRSAVTGVKTGNRPALPELPAYNTSSSVKRIRLASVSQNNVAPESLAGEVLSLKLAVNNGVKGIDVIGTFGHFELVAGDFKVTADLEVLFLTVAAQDAARQNADVTLDIIQVVSSSSTTNSAFVADMPLLTLGDARAKVTKDEPISLPLSGEANSGEQVDAGLDHTLMMCFFDFVPAIASTLT